MTRQEACKILDVYPDISAEDLKKRYRKLMNITHPDSGKEHDYPYDASEINVAYEYLLTHLMDQVKKKRVKEKHQIKWNAPVNPNAFVDREIYQFYEDQDGNRLGMVTIDTGKYMWIPDEDFSLFLKSLYQAARNIITADDEVKQLNRTSNLSLMADITYLLSGQFFGADTALSLMRKDDDAYYTKAYLESGRKRKLPKADEYVLPMGVKNHRLFVSDITGNELGYLSFADDRILFGLIPLFERKAVQVKMVIAKEKTGARKMTEVHMWVKPIPEESSASIDSISLRIQQLLDESQ